jgi:exodeoxyribonuclease V alpha subunit
MSLSEYQSLGLVELLDVELARALGRMAPDSSPEVELAIALTSRNVRRGHSCFPVGMSAVEVWPNEPTQPDALPGTVEWKEALTQSRLTQRGPLVLDAAGRLYLRRYWQLEQDIARELAARSALPPIIADDARWLDAALDQFFPGEPDSPQRRAAQNALRHRVSLLCGGPGTGKTTTVAAIVALIIQGRLRDTKAAPKVMLLAPTGKSAARLGEAVRKAKTRIDAPKEILQEIPEQATTVHRALGMRREGVRFRRSADLPLEADVIIVDEASMVDLGLMRQLLNAAPREATLLIVGDPHQLTSVEAGSVLRDLVTASAETWWRDRVTQLTTTYRYDEGEPLGQLVAAIRTGEGAIVDALLEADADDVVWSSSDGLQGELDRAAAHWAKALAALDPKEHFELRGRYVMLSPFRRGAIGTQRLGSAIQERLPSPAIGAPRITPIIIEQNRHELRVFNGDLAMLVDGEPRTATVQSDVEAFREIAEARLPQFSDAFALSIHKAQGSEFDEVLVVLPEEDAPLLTRELLYTAVSRARQRVRIVGSKRVVSAAIERRAQRYSGLVDAIGEARG